MERKILFDYSIIYFYPLLFYFMKKGYLCTAISDNKRIFRSKYGKFGDCIKFLPPFSTNRKEIKGKSYKKFKMIGY